MAMSTSVTVSIGDDTMGVRMVMLRVSFVDRSTVSAAVVVPGVENHVVVRVAHACGGGRHAGGARWG